MFISIRSPRMDLLFTAFILVLIFGANPEVAQSQEDNPVPFWIRVGVIHEAPLGEHAIVPVTKTAGSEPMYGFDFLVGYDASALTALRAGESELYEIYGWEYFTYRHGRPGDCGDGCPSGMIRAVGVYDMNDGIPNTIEQTIADSTELFHLDFLVSDHYSLEGTFVPIRFFWIDCGDNTVAYADPNDTTLGISDSVIDFDGRNIADPEAGFSTYYGAPNECIDTTAPGTATRFVNYINGGIDIQPFSDIDDRGDINLNGVAYEIADYIVFTNYFIYGLSAFYLNADGQAAATDVNADGLPLEIEDLVYLARVIEGEVLPFPDIPDVTYESFNGYLAIVETDTSFIVKSVFDEPVGGLHICFYAPDLVTYDDYEILLFPAVQEMDALYNTKDDSLKILLSHMKFYPDPEDSSVSQIDTAFADLLEIVYTGQKPFFTYASASGYFGQHVELQIAVPANNPPVFESYPAQLSNNYYGGFYFDFNAQDQDVPTDPLRYYMVSGPGEIYRGSGEWRYAPLCVDSGTTMRLEVCVADPLHPCPQVDPGLHAVVELIVSEAPPILGDNDGSGDVDVIDITYLISYLYDGGPRPVPVPAAGDVDNNGRLNLLDITYLISYLYKNGPEPVCP